MFLKIVSRDAAFDQTPPEEEKAAFDKMGEEFHGDGEVHVQSHNDEQGVLDKKISKSTTNSRDELEQE